MNVEGKIKDCEYYLKQINHFNPDPHYVSYFFQVYLQSVIDVYDEILNQANRDFGLFISGKCTQEKFERKAADKNDKLALKFLTWFKENYEKEHTSPYSKKDTVPVWGKERRKKLRVESVKCNLSF